MNVLELVWCGLLCCVVASLLLTVYCAVVAGKRADEKHTPPKMDKWD